MISTVKAFADICKKEPIILGRQMENNYRQIIFDCSGFSETITDITLVHQRSQDAAPYIVASSSGDTLTWTISDNDTAYYGYGRGEIRITFSGGLAKSVPFQTVVIKSITADTTIPDPLQSWYDQMIAYIDEHSVTLDEVDAAVEAYLIEHPIEAPVQSVNGETGTVVLTASDVGALPDSTTIPSRTSQLTNDSGFLNAIPSEYVTETEMQTALASKADTADIPTAVSDLTNDSGYITSAGAPVQSVNGQTGAVTVSVPVSSVNGRTGAVTGLAEAWTVQNMTSADTTVTLQTDKFYVFPEMSALTVTVTAVGMYAFRFTSGTTATVLTVTGATMPDSFTVEASKVYEVNVYQGYGVVSAWAAS